MLFRSVSQSRYMALTALLAYFSPFGGDLTRIVTITWVQFLAFALLVGGGILIAIDFPFKRSESVSPLVIVAGICMSISLLLLKYGYYWYDVNFERPFYPVTVY